MGHLENGVWKDEIFDTKSTGGRYVRNQSVFRNWVTADGEGGFKAEPDRYHLYVSHACPWAHRTMIFRSLKGLQDIIPFSVVHWFMGPDGWTFDPGDGVVQDPLFGSRYLHEIYTTALQDYSGRVSVPILWDKHRATIVSNESSEIIRMFNSAFDGIGAKEGDYYPLALRAEIDELNERIYEPVNNGVYKSGFATNQLAYEEAVEPLFDTLDWLEERLGNGRYLLGSVITEADWRLFTTLVRFDPVYVSHFKCNLKRIADYPNLSNFLRDLYQYPGVSETVNFDHIKKHYFQSHTTVNPTQIVPKGPVLDHTLPHDRENLDKMN